MRKYPPDPLLTPFAPSDPFRSFRSSVLNRLTAPTGLTPALTPASRADHVSSVDPITPITPACYQDFQCAIRYVHSHADQYNVDTSRIFLIGQSAGGHLVSLAATLGDGPWPRTGGWERRTTTSGPRSPSRPVELPTLSWGNLWTPAGQAPDEARALASPVKHLNNNSKPLLVLHSDNDKSVPIENALLMVEALKKAGADFQFHRVPRDGPHGNQ